MPAHFRNLGRFLLAAPLLFTLSMSPSCFGAAANIGEEEIVKPKPDQLAPAPASPEKPEMDVLSDSGQFYLGLPQRPKRKLTVNEAIRLALKNNTDLDVETLNPEIQREQIRQAWGAFDPEFFASGTYELIETPQSLQEFVATGGDTTLPRNNRDPRVFDEENYRYKVSLGGKSPLGTQYEFKIESDSLANTLNRESPLALYTPEYTSFAGLVLTQPLLRDAGTKAGMAEIRIARKTHQIADLDLQTNVLKTVAAVIRTYQDLVFAAENVRVKKEAVDLARQLLNDNRSQMERGMRQERDVLVAESAVSKGYEELLLATNFQRERGIALMRLISNNVDEGGSELVPADSVRPVVPKLNRIEQLREALEHRPAYLKSIQEAEREDIRVQFARNQVLPKLDLKATLGYNGLSSSYSDSVGDAFAGRTPEVSVGFVVSIPLGNIRARAELDAAKKKQVQAILKIKSAEADAMQAIDKALSAIQINTERVRTAERSRALNERSLRNEELSLERGTTTSLNLLKFQQEYTEARTREIAANVDLSNSIVDLYEATGVLLDRRQISFINPKAAPDKKVRTPSKEQAIKTQGPAKPEAVAKGPSPATPQIKAQTVTQLQTSAAVLALGRRK